MSKRGIPDGAVVRGTDKGYDDPPKVTLTPGSERPVEQIDKTYPYLRPRDAATLILVRMRGSTPEVLMGCRAAAHAFMPNRYVFPGGKVDPDDARVPVATSLDPFVNERLMRSASAQRARALAVAAVRETFEESGLMLGKPLAGGAPRKDYGEHWKGFLDQGMAPALDCLDLIARAVTPPGRPRRFNARFFMARAEDASGEIRHSSEMGDIRWVQLDEARELPLPTITGLILGEIGRLVKEPPDRTAQRKIPLFTTVHRKHLMIEE
ncbi:NUDIX domain-containing protein [Reyranella sp.]|uniref:NUDIX hydrolase n=1 Tax=Reyranella sp. TaxID=1929291 RepID=UPI00272406B9|nr:NUDIX domain-containing protein [Reyranella sp.]MDO8977143.1 NUDIX domain-containing protein [Reyranella sp.]